MKISFEKLEEKNEELVEDIEEKNEKIAKSQKLINNLLQSNKTLKENLAKITTKFNFLDAYLDKALEKEIDINHNKRPPPVPSKSKRKFFVKSEKKMFL